jgi:signal transduction histidine kinase
MFSERGPLQPKQIEDALRELQVELPSRLRTVLLVDDESENLEVHTALLCDTCNVLTATSGEEALQVLSERREVDLIIADQRMHGMTGVELLARVAAERPDIVRIVLTGYSDVEPMRQAINQAKAWRFLMKPCDPEQLRASAREALLLKERVELLARLTRLLTERRDSLAKTLRELQLAQDELLALERLATVGPAVAGIVHNLRNLSTLMSFVMTEIARRDVSHSVHETVNSAQSSMESLIELLEHVHQLAQPCNLDLKLEFIDLERFIGTTAALGMIHSGGHPVEVATNAARPKARIDVERMRQGLLALVDNAVRASHDQQPIRLTAKTVPPPSVTAAEGHGHSGEWLCIEVTDHGCGMDGDTLSRAVEPFYSGFSPPRMGLGLEFARLAARAHGGRVELESNPGQGTVARLLVPVEISNEEIESSA